MTAASTDPERLAGLADRCEEASGADRELDALISTIVRIEAVPSWARTWAGEWRATPEGHVVMMHADGKNGPWFTAREWTASLDAAMSLVPDSADAAGERFRLEAYSSPGVLAPHVRASAWVAGAPRVFAATPALALCAASLRARSHQETRP